VGAHNGIVDGEARRAGNGLPPQSVHLRIGPREIRRECIPAALVDRLWLSRPG
jgi:hypothetical protein